MSKKNLIDRIVIFKAQDDSRIKDVGYTMILRPAKPTLEFRPQHAKRVYCSNSPAIFAKYFQPFVSWLTTVDETKISFFKQFNSKAECNEWCSNTIFEDADLLWSVFMMSGEKCVIFGSYRCSDIALPDIFYSLRKPQQFLPNS